jgi:hypothetical protein
MPSDLQSRADELTGTMALFFVTPSDTNFDFNKGLPRIERTS